MTLIEKILPEILLIVRCRDGVKFTDQQDQVKAVFLMGGTREKRVFHLMNSAEISELSELLKKKRKEGLTFIIVSHDLKTLAPLVDRVVVVSFGRLIADGSFEDVIADKKVKEAYLGK